MLGGTIQADRLYHFGTFSLSPRKRLLFDNGNPVRLGSRALDILIVLTERNGELVTKDDLIARIWPTTVVVEDNLKVQMTAVRRALRDGCNGNRYIVNEPSRGYRFVAQVGVTDWPPLIVQTLPSVSTDEISASVLRLVELCCMIETSRQSAVAISSGECESPEIRNTAVSEILRRGVWALEFARTLLSMNPNQPDSTQDGADFSSEDALPDLRRLAGRWMEELSHSDGWAH